MDFKKMIQGMKDKEAKEENPKNVEAKEPNDLENPVELDKQTNLEDKPIAPKPQAEEKLNGVRGQFPKFIEDLKSTYKENGDMRFDEDAISDNIYRMGKGLEDDEIDLLTKELSKALENEGFENETKHKKGEPQQAPKEQPKEAPKPQEQPQEKPTIEASFSAKMNKPIQKSEWGTNEYETDDGEQWFIGTEEEAYEAAKEDIRDFVDDVGYAGFTDNFKDWIYANAVDSGFLAELRSEEADYFRGEGENDQAEWIENLDDGETISYLEDTFGRDVGKFLEENNAIDFDKVAEEAISLDGIAHFLASYDGDEVELPNGLYAYRRG